MVDFVGVHLLALAKNIFRLSQSLVRGQTALANKVRIILAALFLEVPFPAEQAQRYHTGRARDRAHGTSYTVHLLPPLVCAWISQATLILCLFYTFEEIICEYQRFSSKIVSSV